MRISHTNRPLVVVTMGDPAGIGPEVIAGALSDPDVRGLADLIVVGDARVMLAAFESRGLPQPKVHDKQGSGSTVDLSDGRVLLMDPGIPLDNAEPGKPTREGAQKTLDCLDLASDIMKEGSGSGGRMALVTAPVNKEMISGVKPGFIGHTEYLRDRHEVDFVTMVLVGEKLRVVPVTRHIPLKDVSRELTGDLLMRTLMQVVDARVVICGRNEARIGVSALNPHGGEGGKIGKEDISVIKPTIDRARAVYPHIVGPIPADVIFHKAFNGGLDIVMAMYHDQGLAPFKMVEFETGVNMTIGLPYVRTSPDHGTAFDIAGKNIASSVSFKQAIKCAVKAVRQAV
ncbi:MAG: 4-hydroxythreonine-4-phosphate dehydrogenase PdxA [Candidatus Omnitrophica bacterium]|nr:4-hydroxythreonine-4-phosphate dehydrogenase PdxA [Candidatus Omnitrophota bacterium]MDD5488402.1 4-hydroxythreonine-4-phosphate dehydrogenase PdxA [Candidatus Omnitrophota bacterium]